MCRLSCCHADGPALGDEGCKALAEGLKNNQAVTCIELRAQLLVCYSNIGEAGFKALAESLEINQTISCINLAVASSAMSQSSGARTCYERFGNEGCEALALMSLEMNQALTSIASSRTHRRFHATAGLMG
eukprot:6183998-Pleurochrysis_carterae.AAC.7